MITARVADVIEMIIDHNHDGSIEDVFVCQGSFDKEQLDPNKTLEEVGINTDGNYTLIYDFKPFSDPLLTTSL